MDRLMNVIKTAIPDVLIFEPKVFGDERGFFFESFNHKLFEEVHYQTENTQGKLVRVVFGEVFDVAVDMRKNSPTFGKWIGVYLSAENKRQLWLPEGFAHGFYVTSEEAEFVYKCSDYYNPKSEHSLLWNDPDIGIDWPVDVNNQPLLSAKDESGLLFSASRYL